MAIDERQVDDGLLIDDSSERSVLSLKKRRLGANVELFLCALDCQLNLQPAHLGDSNLNALQDEWLKSGPANLQVIVARTEERNREISLGIRNELALLLCGLTLHGYFRMRDHGSTGVAHGTSDGAGVGRLAAHRQSAKREHGSPEEGAERDVPHHVVPPTIRGRFRLLYDGFLR